MNYTVFPTQVLNSQEKEPEFHNYLFNLEIDIWLNKPKKALWTSPLKMYDKNGESFPISPWLFWCYYENFRIYDYTFIIYPKTNLKLYKIENDQDIENVPKIKLKNYDNILSINFERLKEENYDGVYLTAIGANKYHSLKQSYMSFNTWDVESICWFHTNWIQSIELIPNYRKKLFKFMK